MANSSLQDRKATTAALANARQTLDLLNSQLRAGMVDKDYWLARLEGLEQALDSALLVVPQEQLGPGSTATVEFTFPEEAAGQLLEFSCLIRRHYEDEMFLGITVTQ